MTRVSRTATDAKAREKRLIEVIWGALPDRLEHHIAAHLTAEISGSLDALSIRLGQNPAAKRDNWIGIEGALCDMRASLREAKRRMQKLQNPDDDDALDRLRGICDEALGKLETLASEWGTDEPQKGAPRTLESLELEYLDRLCRERAGMSHGEFADLIAALNGAGDEGLHALGPLSIESLRKRKQRARKKAGTK